MSDVSYKIPLSVDEVLFSYDATTPTILVKLLVFWELTALGLTTLETSTLLPIPLYGCGTTITNAELSGSETCRGGPLFGTSREPTNSMLSSCAIFSQWEPLAWAGALLTLGRMLMCLAGGIGADVFGRRRSALVWCGCYFAFAFIRSFAPIIEIYITCITLESICSQVATISLILIVCEGCTQKECVRTVCLVMLGHAISVSVLIPIVYINLENEIYRQLARSTPALIFVFLVMGLPESLRWVLSQGKLENIEPTIRSSHGVELDEFGRAKLFQINTQIRKERAAYGCSGNLIKQSVCPLFTAQVFWRITLPFVFISFFIGTSIGFRLIYDTLPYHSIEDRLITSGIAEILAIQLLGLLFARLPIKRVAAMLSVLLSLFLMGTRALNYFGVPSCIGNMVLSGGGHLASVLLWVWLLLSSIRLIPTPSRGALMGICVSFGTLGHSFSRNIYESFQRDLEWGMFYPAFVFAIMVTLSGFLCLILPDTPKAFPDMMCHIFPRKMPPRLIESSPEEEEENTEV